MNAEVLLNWLSQYGYVGLFGILVFGIIGLPIPDETLLALAGFFVSEGRLSFVPTILAAFLGSACGISVSYTIGRTAGAAVISRYGHRLFLTPERLARVERWFSSVGAWVLLFGYFIPGVRHLTAIAAGTTKLKLPVFCLFAYSGALLWALTFITLGYFFGKSWGHLSAWAHQTVLIAVVLAVVAAIFWHFVRARRSV